VCDSLLCLGFHPSSVVGVEYNGVKNPILHGLRVVEPYHRDHIQVLKGKQDYCYLLNGKI
jgi:hypothetical protein